jgi:integrase
MSSLFRQKTIVYHTKGGKRCRSSTPGAIRSEVESKKWYGEYRGANGKPVRVPLSESKDTARRMLAKLAGDAQLAGVGIVDPFGDHRATPLAEHLEDFRRYLAAKGNVSEHVAKTAAQCRAIIEGCRFEAIEDLQPSAVVEFLADLRQRDGKPLLDPAQEFYQSRDVAGLLGVRVDSINRMVRRGQLQPEGKGRGRRFPKGAVEAMLDRRRGIGVVTSNHYLTAIKQFSKWLMKDRRAPYDVLACLSRQNANADLRHERRSLPAEAFGVFVAAARKGKTFRGLTGPDRATLYRFASHTGLRAGELASLTPTSFALDAEPPTVTVEAAYSKHRRKDVLPLRADVAALMRSYITGKPKGKPLWPGSWAEAGAEMVRLDLLAAGISYVDERGLVYDFHALRHQFISSLAAAGVHPKAAQELARHSTITLTMDYYTHLELHDQSAALEKLPELPADAEGEQAAPAVGQAG